jgi:CheY-like chemotaxis protein
MELGELPGDIRENLGQIARAAEDAAEVVRRLQSFSRTQRQAEFRRLDLGVLCAEVVELLRPLWATRRLQGRPAIAVRVRAETGLTVRGQPTELREVVTNLVKNAVEALDRGGNLHVLADRADHRVRLEVVDDGTGISPEDLKRVFVPFFTTKGDRGTGLGLCLAQQIVERHGGEIHIRSALGSGTTATVLLPCEEPVMQSARREARSDGSGACKVLVVDDDPDVLGILCTYLQRRGYRVDGAGTAGEGLESAEATTPDVIISDIAMPGMDGIELCRRVKARMPDVPVVLMSGQASAIDPERIRTAGASALLPKPFTMRQVVDLLAELGPAHNKQ